MSSTPNGTDPRSDIRGRQINGLRLLADTLDSYPGLRVPDLQVIADTDDEVRVAAAVQRADVTYRNGHTLAELIFDGLGVHVFHVSDERLAEHHARHSYSTVVQP